MWGPRTSDLKMESGKQQKKCDKTSKSYFLFIYFLRSVLRVSVSPRGLLGLNAGSLKSAATQGD